MKNLLNNDLKNKVKKGTASEKEIYSHYDKVRKRRMLGKTVVSGATTAAAAAGSLLFPPAAVKLGYVAGVSGGKFVNDIQNRSGFSKTKFNQEQKERAISHAKKVRAKQLKKDQALKDLKNIRRQMN